MRHAPDLVVLLVVGIAMNLIAACASGAPHPQGSWDQVVSLEAWPTDRRDEVVVSTDSTAIEALIAVMRNGEATNDHRCGNSHTLVFHRADGGTVTVGLLSGHKPESHEFRLYGDGGYRVFRVERAAFLRTLAELGIK